MADPNHPKFALGPGHVRPPVVGAVPPGPKIEVPVTAQGASVYDRNGMQLANCLSPELAARLAYIINDHAVLG